MKVLSSLGNCDVRLKSGEKIWGEVSEVEICGQTCLQVFCPVNGTNHTFNKYEWAELSSLNDQQVSFRIDDFHSILSIKLAVAQSFELDVFAFESKARPEHIAWPRQIAMFLAYASGTYVLVKIGESFGNRDHGTVLHSIKRVKNRMQTEPEISRLVHDLARRLHIKIPATMDTTSDTKPSQSL